ncbi:Spy/CpxP family protein refolding chaperone [Methylotenera sp.]|uniref:Spy/CpxP family protein refolding chaperone n=1 Tax=Methylotenera sp. TaxID=2051956 RepID=UPI002EDB83DE
MKITTPILVLALAAMTVPFVTQAEPAKRDRCEHAEKSYGAGKFSHDAFTKKGLPPHLAALNLSDSQQDKVFELIYPQVPQIRQSEKQREQLMSELKALSNSAAFDSDKANQITEKLAAIDKEAMFNRAATDNQIFLILSQEQRKQLAEMKPHHADGFSRSRFHHGSDQAKKLERLL